jgi:hypothetical protein
MWSALQCNDAAAGTADIERECGSPSLDKSSFLQPLRMPNGLLLLLLHSKKHLTD